MTLPLRRRRPAAPSFEVVHRTNHWRRHTDGRWLRDVVVRTATGELRLYGFPEQVAA